MPKHKENGIYATCSMHGPKYFHPDRHVYIEDDVVRLVGSVGTSIDLFNYDWWFKVNILGERIGDLPEDFKMKAYP